MRTRKVLLTGLVCSILASTAAHAVDTATYQAVRSSLNVTPVGDAAVFVKQQASKAGQVVEFDGVVSGVAVNSAGLAFLMRTADGQTLMFSSRKEDPDIEVAASVRVLARVPMSNTLLECLAATSTAPAAGTAPVAGVADDEYDDGVVIAEAADHVSNPPNEMPVDERPPVIFYKAPARINEQPGRVMPAAMTAPDYVQIYAAHIRAANSRLAPDVAEKIAYHLLDKSQRYGVDPRLVFALVTQESRFNPQAVSRAGAQGLGQLMPGTADGLGVRDPFDIEQNLDGAVRYLSTQLRNFGRLSTALAAYNAGPGNVKKYNGVPPFRETRNYIRKIWNHYCTLAGIDPDTGQPAANR